MLELVWRRARKGPRLLQCHRDQRLEWCLMNQNNEFLNTIFTDETCSWINEIGFYFWRHPSTYPTVIDMPVKRLKINVWGGISAMGPTEFVVIIIFKINYLHLIFRPKTKIINIAV